MKFGPSNHPSSKILNSSTPNPIGRGVHSTSCLRNPRDMNRFFLIRAICGLLSFLYFWGLLSTCLFFFRGGGGGGCGGS